MKIIAIDPGYERVGIAILEKNAGKEVLLFSECFKTLATETAEERLQLIGEEIFSLIKKYKPEALTIETLFFKTNAKTAMRVSEARGVMLYEAAKNGLLVTEFTPLQIKVAVTGYGKSDKNQVTSMVQKLIKINKDIKHDDEYDAIAVGLTYFACY
ncbi:MAG: crossover junction endodeoxyribonuclease RuvC [Candidatus Taylorbacteria bacterium RIFOXYD2_FULL_36_9]|uniref:Crossover junction endodeoxyribonuclease RuvC n=1 Tax=Candidatus Taylorbacteria bacterium RIFOXYD2_FULL_36_9 TaxID=1802338 RepID=A0A1G2PJT6_9BACT|nr:MAG: crossover junction endodeoxyribonuclease RuvC [Candidatus Taylorbacteria bacterium RIFOXYD2_FULL_36_9]